MSHYKETDAFALKLGPFEVPVAFDEYELGPCYARPW